MQSAPEAEALKQTFAELMAIPEVSRYLAGMVSGLDIRYDFEGPDHELLGSRLPDVELSVADEQKWASELLRSGRGVLLTTDSRYTETARPWSARVDLVPVPELPSYHADAVLVRPDGYICWVASAGDTTESVKRLDAALRGWFGS